MIANGLADRTSSRLGKCSRSPLELGSPEAAAPAEPPNRRLSRLLARHAAAHQRHRAAHRGSTRCKTQSLADELITVRNRGGTARWISGCWRMPRKRVIFHWRSSLGCAHPHCPGEQPASSLYWDGSAPHGARANWSHCAMPRAVVDTYVVPELRSPALNTQSCTRRCGPPGELILARS